MAKAKWEDLTPAQRRVEIAKDVIASIQAGRITTGHTYFGLNEEVKVGKLDTHKEIGIEEPLSSRAAREVQKNCRVCAMGALMVSRVCKFNKLSLEDLGQNEYGSTVEALKGAFTDNQLRRIEAAYELDSSYEFMDEYAFGMDHVGDYEAMNYQEQDENRMLAIMQNIVDHGGTFKPKVRYEVK